MNLDDIQTMFQTVLGKYGIVSIVGIFLLIFKSSIEKFVSCLFVFYGNDFNEDDIVYLDSRPARIVRIGLLKTTFYIYNIKDGKVCGGTKLVVQNECLSSLNIEKPLLLISSEKLNEINKNS